MAVKQRILNILISIDQLIYVLLTLGAGNPDETMSAAAWRLEQKGKLAGRIFRPVIDVLFWFDKDHCKTSYESELNKAKDLLEKHNK